MWDGAELRYRLAEGRGSQIDWLPDGAPIGRVALTLAAMANAQGGWLLLGVEPDTNRIVGLGDTAESVEQILQAAEIVDPSLILPVPRALPIDGRVVLAVRVPAGLPHLYALDGRYFIRDGSLNAPLAAPRLRRLLLERGDPGAEGDCPAGATPNDLDLRAAAEYLEALGGPIGADPIAGLRRRGCLVVVDGRPSPTLAGLLLFGIDPQRWAPNAELRVARHAGRTPGGQVRTETIQGRLAAQIQAATQALGAMIAIAPASAPGWGWPASAIQELIANAVVHRDYGMREAPVHIDVFSDRLEVHSPGGLPGPVTLETLTTRRFLRNPVIAQVLDDQGGQGVVGDGIEGLMTWAGRSGARPPVFEEAAGGVRVTLYARGERLDSLAGARREQSRDGASPTGGGRREVQPPVAERVGESETASLTSGPRGTLGGGWHNRPPRRVGEHD